MFRKRALAIAAILIAFAFTSSVEARRIGGGGSRHSYPSHSGLSGHGSSRPHSYPPSHGLSGAGGAHQPHQQQHTSVQHSAPPGHQSGGGAHSYPSNQGGLSGAGGHSYPKSPGLSGHGGQTGHNGQGGATNVHYNQHVYNPPPQIHYTPVHGAPPAHPYPVYHGPPPVYVHEIRDSGSRFSTLLTGLALYNLGRSASGFHGHHSSSSAPREDAPGERCTLRIEQDRNLERVKIPCYIVSTFTDVSNINSTLNASTNSTTTPGPVSISASEVTAAPLPTTNNTSIVVDNRNATNVSENTTAVVGNATQVNSSLVVQNATTVPPTTPPPAPEPIEAVKLKGEPVQLKKDARCFVEKETKTSSSRKEIECGLLQQYAVQSMQRQPPPQQRGKSDATTFTSHFVLLSASIAAYLVV